MSESTNNGTGASTNGRSTAELDFSAKLDGDLFSDREFEEIARRLIVFYNLPVSGIHRGPSPPTRKDFGWLPTDSNNVPVGAIRTFNAATGQWESDLDALTDPARFNDSDISEDTGNIATIGSDGNLFVPSDGGRFAQYYNEEVQGSSELNQPLEYGIARDPAFTNVNQYHISVEAAGDYADLRWFIQAKALTTFHLQFAGTQNINYKVNIALFEI